MRRSVTGALTAAVLLAAVVVASPAAAAQLPEWVRPAAVKAAPAAAMSSKLAPMVAHRPAMLLETDYYFFPYAGGDRPTVYLTVDGNGYADPVTLWR